MTSISVDERIALLSSVEKRPYRKADFAGSKHDHFRIARDLGAIRQALMSVRVLLRSGGSAVSIPNPSSRAGGDAAGYIPY